jgi:F0F1-type ATP synthase alpha subunit
MVAAGSDIMGRVEEVTGAAELVAKAGVDVTEEEEGVGLTMEEDEVGLIMMGNQGVEAEVGSTEG